MLAGGIWFHAKTISASTRPCSANEPMKPHLIRARYRLADGKSAKPGCLTSDISTMCPF